MPSIDRACLLDQDLAARSASLGRLYRDLGFEQLAPVEGWKSLDADPGDYSGHRLLADTYSALPRHEVARVSELLQSQLLQPVNITPVPPHLAETDLFILERAGPDEPGFNEFNPLFNRNRLALLISGTVGGESILGDEVTASGVLNRVSFSVGQFHYDADGLRKNNQQDRDLLNAFVQTQLSPATNLQAEFRSENIHTGDLVVNFDPADFSPAQVNRAEGTTTRVGLRHVFSSSSSVIASVYARNRDEDFSETLTDGGFITEIKNSNQIHSWTAEARHFLHSGRFSLTSGVGYFHSERTRDETLTIPDPDPALAFSFERHLRDEPQQTNAYAYSTLDLPHHVTLAVGASGDFYSRRLLKRDQFNPKVGVTWSPTSATTIRAAGFRTLNRAFVSTQTIEPTQVAGFNQLFADREGDDARNFGIALDRKFGDQAQKPVRFFAGGEYSHRQLSLPAEFANQFFEILKRLKGTEQFGRCYFYWTPSDQISISAEYFHEQADRDAAATGEEAFMKIRTNRLPVGIRFFWESGLGGYLRATAVNQTGSFFIKGLLTDGTSKFMIVDGAIGYRLPRRYGRLLFEVRNIFNNEFQFQDADPGNPTIRSGRVAVFRLVLSI